MGFEEAEVYGLFYHSHDSQGQVSDIRVCSKGAQAYSQLYRCYVNAPDGSQSLVSGTLAHNELSGFYMGLQGAARVADIEAF